MKNLNTIQKKAAGSARSASTQIKAKAKRASQLAAHGPSLDGALGLIEEAYDKAKTSVSGFSVGKVAKAEYVVPVAIGSFLLGAATAALGVFLAPKIRDSEMFATMKDNFQSATATVQEGLATAIHDVKATVREKKTNALKTEPKSEPVSLS